MEAANGKWDPASYKQFSGVKWTYESNSKQVIKFDTQDMDSDEQCVQPGAIALCNGRKFDIISIKGKKCELGRILKDIAKNFTPPKELNFNLFFANKLPNGEIETFENLALSEENVRKTFTNWKNSDVKVIFRCNEEIVRVFNLSGAQGPEAIRTSQNLYYYPPVDVSQR